MERVLAFEYGHSFFRLRALMLAALFVAVLVFFAFQTQTPAVWLGILAATFLSYLVIVGLSPLLTRHQLTRSRIILRQGWYFRAILPFAEVETVSPWDGEPKYGLRLSLARRSLFVVGSGRDLVSVRLREWRRFPLVLFLKAREVVFDVDDRDAFLAAVEARVAAGEPLPARKVPILPDARR